MIGMESFHDFVQLCKRLLVQYILVCLCENKASEQSEQATFAQTTRQNVHLSAQGELTGTKTHRRMPEH